ncbi:alkaline phosphatase family protein [Opitutus terrae]|uniref:Type I phosphodiesterase/nucleotide pyrophosphatase n=1 Tax=Opitutus terrae (strain DSM 11246 / JCM 15787 / PB90-1) TaxID=452637 RepID=B1ZZ31_OPITP|nr:ectonucleotide pyrophosphatase/phosphodiesterase [Opitutus terrae]ACB77103.1 type I phosphodiesterase/nucleotide pyrophosphatase [Opitutus terrae PB90-1]
MTLSLFRRPRLLAWGSVFLLALTAAAARSAALPQRPIPAIEYVMVVSIDGMRPDVALLADTPTLHALVREGAYTFWAKTTAVSITLPSHVSMLTGVTPGRHGIMWNKELPFAEPVYPAVPTIMELATRAGYTTALVAGKPKFAALNKPGTITYSWIQPKTATDAQVATAAVEIIEQHQPAFLMVHFPAVDGVGHDFGWGSPEQRERLEQTDREFKRVLDALDRTNLRAKTLVLVTADHGGTGLTHGAEDPRSRHIPWIVAGPGVRRFYDLTRVENLEVRTEDTFATVAYLLGLPLPEKIDGKPVRAAFTDAR